MDRDRYLTTGSGGDAHTGKPERDLKTLEMIVEG